MNNPINNLKVDAQSKSYNYRISNIIEVAEKYGMIADSTKLSADEVTLTDEIITPSFYYTKKNDKNVYDIFYGQMHIHVSLSENESIYSIRIKRYEDDWKIVRKNDILDFSHPVNHNLEIFIWYQVPVLDVTTADGSIYAHGSWDKTVFNTMRDFYKSVEQTTDFNRFNDAYKRFDKWRKKLKKKK